MTPRTLLSALIVLGFAGAEECLGQDALKTETLLHGGLKRTYHHVDLRADQGATKLRPLVIALHGGGGRGIKFDRGTTRGTLGREAKRLGFVVVYPEGIAKGWNDGRPEGPHLAPERKGVDDVGFISALIDHLIATRKIDPLRVYATGISNGGIFSFRLACDLSHKIAAIAPVTASMHPGLLKKTPSRPVSVLVANGTADPLVPYTGGAIRLRRRGANRGTMIHTDKAVAFWVRQNGCQTKPTLKNLPDLAPRDGTTVQRKTYSGGKEGSKVVLYRIKGGGHTWPGGTQYLPKFLVGPTCRDINLSKVILEFFKAHSRQPKPPKSPPG